MTEHRILDAVCSTCGRRVAAGQPCSACGSPTAIAAGEPPLARSPSLGDEPLRTILKEYHYSFLRIFSYYLLIAAVFVIGAVIFLRFFNR